MTKPSLIRALLKIISLLALSAPLAARSVEWSGVLDVRALAGARERSWTDAGLGKTRYNGSGIRLGQAILGAELSISDEITAWTVLNSSDDRQGLVDLQETWLGWNPVPTSAWKLRSKLGLFFPPMNQEIDYDRVDWMPTRTISASAINSWVGEELRTRGLEFSMTHRGRASGSKYDFGATVAIFNGNDPAGSLIAWRGWGIGDRVTGASESIKLSDLPVYRPDGPINKQVRDIKLFREIDGRAGYYAALHVSYAENVDVSAMHYDNRGDPSVVTNGQYSWATKFNHFGLRARLPGEWEVMAQWLTGSTMMGANAVALDYRAWFALASHPLGEGALTLRYDQFRAREHDRFPLDANGENGRSLALAYVYKLSSAASLVTELLCVESERPARLLVGELPRQNNRSITTALRWQF